jgi:hypothetical protein
VIGDRGKGEDLRPTTYDLIPKFSQKRLRKIYAGERPAEDESHKKSGNLLMNKEFWGPLGKRRGKELDGENLHNGHQ